jgi:hypothetical protein
LRTVVIKRSRDCRPEYTKIPVEERTRANMDISYDEETIALACLLNGGSLYKDTFELRKD